MGNVVSKAGSTTRTKATSTIQHPVESRQDLNEGSASSTKVPGLAVSMNESEGGSLVGDNKSVEQGTTGSGGSYSYMFTSRTLSGAAGSFGVCGSISDTFTGDDELVVKRRKDEKKGGMLNGSSLLSRAASGTLCASSTEVATATEPFSPKFGPDVDSDEEFERGGGVGSPKVHPMSALFARALVSEVTDNPRTMPQAAMAQREKRLLKAQERARKARTEGVRAVGTPGGVVDPEAGVLDMVRNLSLGGGMTTSTASTEERTNAPLHTGATNNVASMLFPESPQAAPEQARAVSKHSVTIALCLSRHSPVGHPDTVTRQTAFDFNELQDRQYRFLSSTDSSGWLAGGGESGAPPACPDGVDPAVSLDDVDDSGPAPLNNGFPSAATTDVDAGWIGSSSGEGNATQKVPAPDMVHIPIIQIDADSQACVDSIISAIARGEVFIPHMAITPETLAVEGISPPDLTVRFGCERNEALFPDEWQNWCLEFMHNQLYEYFAPMGARWMKRPFQITLARKVRWKTVKHMKKYLARCERVINSWREKGPKYLDPQLSYVAGGTTPEEVIRPHGIYLLRNGRPTNYFAPNFHPPYTTKMTRSLLMNVLGKSWDQGRQEWTSEPVPRIVTPTILMTTLCGCTDPANQGGFVAVEATSGEATRHHVVGDARSLSGRDSEDKVGSRSASPSDPLGKLERDLQVAAATTHSFVSIDHPKHESPGDKAAAAAGVAPPTAAASEAMERELPQKEKPEEEMALPSAEAQAVEPPVLATALPPKAAAPDKSAAAAHLHFVGSGYGLGPATSPFIPVFEPFTSDERDASSDSKEDNSPPWKMRENLFRRLEETRMDGAPRPPRETSAAQEEADKKSPTAGSLATVPEDPTNDKEKEEAVSQAKRSRPVLPHVKGKSGSVSEDSADASPPKDVSKRMTMPVRDHVAKRSSPTKRMRGKWNDAGNSTDDDRSHGVAVGSIDEDMALSAAPSEGAISMGISVGESHTTVPTMNSTPGKFIERERERRKERERHREKERKRMEVLENAIREQKLKGKERQEEKDAVEHEVEKENAVEAKASKEKEKEKEAKKDKKRKKEKEKEKDTGVALVALNPPPTENVSDDPLSFFPTSMIPNEAPSDKKAATVHPKSKPPPEAAARLMSGGPTNSQVYMMSSSSRPAVEGVERTNSQVSLEYSMDSSMVGDGGGHLAADETTVATGGTGTTAAQSLLSYVTRNSDATSTTDVTAAKSPLRLQKQVTARRRQPEDLLEEEPQSSSGSHESVPSDEELFSVGWAKALDPSSGSYYYFTLDRSTIVWDNPLAKTTTTTAAGRRRN